MRNKSKKKDEDDETVSGSSRQVSNPLCHTFLFSVCVRSRMLYS